MILGVVVGHLPQARLTASTGARRALRRSRPSLWPIEGAPRLTASDAASYLAAQVRTLVGRRGGGPGWRSRTPGSTRQAKAYREALEAARASPTPEAWAHLLAAGKELSVAEDPARERARAAKAAGRAADRSGRRRGPRGGARRGPRVARRRRLGSSASSPGARSDRGPRGR